MPRKPTEDHPLTVSVSGNKLNISIGIHALAFAAVDSSSNDEDGGSPLFLVGNARKFAKDVADEILQEVHEGDNAAVKLLANAIRGAIESGSNALAMADDSKPIFMRCAEWDPQAPDAHLVRRRKHPRRFR